MLQPARAPPPWQILQESENSLPWRVGRTYSINLDK